VPIGVPYLIIPGLLGVCKPSTWLLTIVLPTLGVGGVGLLGLIVATVFPTPETGWVPAGVQGLRTGELFGDGMGSTWLLPVVLPAFVSGELFGDGRGSTGLLPVVLPAFVSGPAPMPVPKTW